MCSLHIRAPPCTLAPLSLSTQQCSERTKHNTISSGYSWPPLTSTREVPELISEVRNCYWAKSQPRTHRQRMTRRADGQPRIAGRFKAAGFGLNSCERADEAWRRREGGREPRADFYLLPDREGEEARRMSYSCNRVEPICCTAY